MKEIFLRKRNGYQGEKVLGQRGFGVTYLAYDEELCQEVVLKKYRWEHGSLDNEVINKRDYYKKQRKAFLNEARILSSLFDIKEVVKVLDYFEEKDQKNELTKFMEEFEKEYNPSYDYLLKKATIFAKKFDNIAESIKILEDIENGNYFRNNMLIKLYAIIQEKEKAFRRNRVFWGKKIDDKYLSLIHI